MSANPLRVRLSPGGYRERLLRDEETPFRDEEAPFRDEEAPFRDEETPFVTKKRRFVTKKRRFVTKKRRFVTKKRRFVTKKRRFVIEKRRFVMKRRRFVMETLFHDAPQLSTIHHLRSRATPARAGCAGAGMPLLRRLSQEPLEFRKMKHLIPFRQCFKLRLTRRSTLLIIKMI